MKLFFETAGQALGFLHMVPLGFAAALLLEMSRFLRSLRPVADILVLFLSGMAVLWLIVYGNGAVVRLFHLLGLMTGALIWTLGVGKMIRMIARRQDSEKRMTN